MNPLSRKGQKMNNKLQITGSIAMATIIFSLLLSACGAGAPATPTTDPGAVYTMAAATVQAQLTQAAAANPTAVPPTNTPEPSPTTPPTVEPTVAVAQQPTLAFAGGATALPTLASGINPYMAPTQSQPAGFKVGDVAEFQYNLPADGTVFYPGNAISAEVGFKNIGSVTWTTDYKLVFMGGDQFSGVTVVPMTKAVAPGEKAIFNLAFKAPGEPNTVNKKDYRSYWKLVTQTGANVGYADGSAATMYFKIFVRKE
jgi:prepilin-type processing-associated H-X9-DG protein